MVYKNSKGLLVGSMGSFVVLGVILGIYQEVSRKSWGALGYPNGVQRIPKGSKRGLLGTRQPKRISYRCNGVQASLT